MLNEDALTHFHLLGDILEGVRSPRVVNRWLVTKLSQVENSLEHMFKEKNLM